MGSLHVIEKDNVLELYRVAHNTVIAYKCASSDERAVAYFGISSDNAGSSQICCGENLCGLMYPYVFGRVIVLVLAERLAQCDYKFADTLESLPRICELAEIILCRCMREVIKLVYFYIFPFS
jgi:hypothetical protein